MGSMEALRQHMVKMGIKPAEDPDCDVSYVAIQALTAMESAFKDLSEKIELMFGSQQ